jgi:type IV secretory pathway VirB10-like protein
MIRIVLAAIAALGVTAAQGQVYKCLDSNGRVVYSQNPCPPSMKREAMSPRGIPPAPAAAPADAGADKASKGPQTPAQQEQAFQKRQQDAAKAGKEADQKSAEAQMKAANCDNARKRLAQFEIGGRISHIDDKGERYYMDDSAIETGKAQARADVSKFCN